MMTTRKAKPILFSGPMVRAILDGRKTQTRRVVKPQPVFVGGCDEERCLEAWASERWLNPKFPKEGLPVSEFVRYGLCPYGAPGDRLWVRETFCILDRDGWWNPSEPKDSLYNIEKCPRRNACAYRSECDAESEEARQAYGYKWSPSIHMPRWASRITLEISDVRVQRLQDISEEDAIAEGVVGYDLSGLCHTSAVTPFAQLWDSINGKRAPWDSNPFVWCISFKRVTNES